ncbi:MAG: hypothetical protein N3G74_00280 [Candidatus Micrarchaeota archaeon]|nr:hypothetical protein [Candidatus Micrarchaeota archaeon]
MEAKHEKIKSLDEFKRDAFRRRIIASCLADEFVSKKTELKQNLTKLGDNTDLVLEALKRSKEYYAKWLNSLGEAKIKGLEEERGKEIKKYSATFEENHKKIDEAYKAKLKSLEEEEQKLIKEIDDKYESLSFISDPNNDPLYYISEILIEKGIDPKHIFGNRDVATELGVKFNEYYEISKKQSKERDLKKQEIIEQFRKKREELDCKIKEFKNAVERKESLILEKINKEYDMKIKQAEIETKRSITAKINEIDATINSIESKKKLAFSKVEDEIEALSNDFKSKIAILMSVDSKIPEDLLSKYIYCKIEIKKPQVPVQQTIPEAKGDVKEKTEEKAQIEKDAAKQSSDAQTAENQKVKESASAAPSEAKVENKAVSWSAYVEEKEKMRKRLRVFARYVRTALYTLVFGMASIHLVTNKIQNNLSQVASINKPIAVISQNSNAISNKVEQVQKEKKSRNAEIQKEVKQTANADNKKAETDKGKDGEKAMAEFMKKFEIEKQIGEYSASKLNFETQKEMFKRYVEGIKPNWKEIIGVGKGDKTIGHEIINMLNSSNLSKEKMEIVSKILANANKYSIEDLRDYVKKVLNSSDDELYGVNPKGEITQRIPIPKEISVNVYPSTAAQQAKTDLNEGEKSHENIGVQKDGDTGKKIEKIEEENSGGHSLPTSTAENTDIKTDNKIVVEELVDHIVMCKRGGEDVAVVVKAPKNTNVEDYSEYVCNN